MSPIQTKGDRIKSLEHKATGHFNSFFQSFEMNVAFPKTTSLKEELIIIMRNVKKDLFIFLIGTFFATNFQIKRRVSLVTSIQLE
jgi:hypothetical protein